MSGTANREMGEGENGACPAFQHLNPTQLRKVCEGSISRASGTRAAPPAPRPLLITDREAGALPNPRSQGLNCQFPLPPPQNPP